jgi:tol-pal system beta propeller repeat protein TolB
MKFRGVPILAALILAALLSSCVSRPESDSAAAEGRLLFTDGRPADVWTMDASGAHRTRLTNTHVSESAPQWSPDGTHIAYEAKRRGQQALCVMDASGGGRRCPVPKRYVGPASWSPDGSRLVYVGGGVVGPSWEIYTVEASGGGITRLTHNRLGDFDPQWSPDGRSIAFSRNQTRSGHSDDIYVMAADGGSQRRLTESARFEEDAHPRWSPDGSRLAFTRGEEGASVVYVVDLDGDETKLATGHAFQEPVAAWSPDGALIAYAGDGIFVVDARGGKEAVRVTAPALGDKSPKGNSGRDVPLLAAAPMWSPDGAALLFHRTSLLQGFGFSTPVHVHLMRADGTGARELTTLRGPHAAVTNWR